MIAFIKFRAKCHRTQAVLHKKLLRNLLSSDDDTREDFKSEPNHAEDDDDEDDDDEFLISLVKVETVLVDPAAAAEPIKIENHPSPADDSFDEDIKSEIINADDNRRRRRADDANTDEEFVSNEIYFGDEKLKLAKKTTPQKSKTTPKRGEQKSLTDRFYPCEQCGKFFDVHKMECHLNTHRGKHKHKCTRFNSITHIFYCTAMRPFHCAECGKSFYSNDNLRSHIRHVHSDRYVLECDICGKKLRGRTAFLNHIKYHGDPKLPCPHCDVMCYNP